MKEGGVYMKILSATDPQKQGVSLEGVRYELEAALRSRELLNRANGTFGATLTKDERVAIRRMMSRYWDNSSPFSFDLVGAVIRQGIFIEKMHAIDWVHSPVLRSTMDRLLVK